MKIAFLCASLEPGRDGVGDYTRTLARACADRGHTVALIALCDQHVNGSKGSPPADLTELRLPAATSLPTRSATARKFLSDFAPDWISWQFVSYSYHPKGLIGKEARTWASVISDHRVQVMLHELWIGIDRTEPWKNRIIGTLQRRGLASLLKEMEANRHHTSNPAYQVVLAREGVRADILPLYGNVPVARSSSDVLAPWLRGKTRDALLIGVTFGTLHSQWQPEATTKFLVSTATRLGRTPVVLICGRAGGHAQEIGDRLKFGGAITVVTTGEQTATTMSQIFQAVDFGIAPHPWALIGKSGAAAAMTDHGLPVLVPRDDWDAKPSLDLPPPTPGLLAKLADLTPENAAEWLARKRAPAPALPGIVDRFLESLIL